MSAGILSQTQVEELISSPGQSSRLYGRSQGRFKKSLIGESAIDLALGEHYWEMNGSCRTGQKYKVTDILYRHCSHGEEPRTLSTSTTAVLKKKHVYLFEVDCRLDFRETGLQGKATGRSSVGRLDVLVRLLVDQSDKFDYLDENREHELYVEVTPISFDLEVKRGTTLSQLRLFKGPEQDISLTMEELYHEEDKNFPVVNETGEPFRKPCKENRGDIWFPFSLDLSPDDESGGCSAFVAKRNTKTLPPINPDKKAHYNPQDYWDQVFAKNDAISLKPDHMYILRSRERLRLPPHLALECRSYTTQMGEWRIEYAGFAHPWFGSARKEGTPIIFEVRGHNVPTILTDGIPLGNVRFLRMSKPADEPKSATRKQYNNQELKLSSCFAPWGDK